LEEKKEKIFNNWAEDLEHVKQKIKALEELTEKRKTFENKAEKLKGQLSQVENDRNNLMEEKRQVIARSNKRFARVSKKELAEAKAFLEYFEHKKSEYEMPLFYEGDYKGEKRFDLAKDIDKKLIKIKQDIKSAEREKSRIDKNINTQFEKIFGEIDSAIAAINKAMKSLEEEQYYVDLQKEREKKMNELIEKTVNELEEIVALPEEKENLLPSIKRKKEIVDQRSSVSIREILKNYLHAVRDGFFQKIGVDKENAEMAIEKLKEEVRKVKETFFLSINLCPDILLKVLEEKRYKSIFELPANVRTFYSRQNRADYEKKMGIYGKGGPDDPYVIYGALASNNGHDEECGGAEWGNIILVLKPSKKDETVFYYGDSIDVFDQANPKKQLNLKHALIAKAIKNLFNETYEEDQRFRGFGNYIEAQILGGVKIDDVQEIRIHTSHFKKAKHPDTLAIQEAEEMIKKIKEKYPEYANLIKEV